LDSVYKVLPLILLERFTLELITVIILGRTRTADAAATRTSRLDGSSLGVSEVV